MKRISWWNLFNYKSSYDIWDSRSVKEGRDVYYANTQHPGLKWYSWHKNLRTLTVINQEKESTNYLEFYKKYLTLRPENTWSPHLFLAMHNGKVTNQVVGKNTIESSYSKIGKYLNLPDPSWHHWTSLGNRHAFRSNFATILANKEVDILGLKRHKVWRSFFKTVPSWKFSSPTLSTQLGNL